MSPTGKRRDLWRRSWFWPLLFIAAVVLVVGVWTRWAHGGVAHILGDPAFLGVVGAALIALITALLVQNSQVAAKRADARIERREHLAQSVLDRIANAEEEVQRLGATPDAMAQAMWLRELSRELRFLENQDTALRARFRDGSLILRAMRVGFLKNWGDRKDLVLGVLLHVQRDVIAWSRDEEIPRANYLFNYLAEAAREWSSRSAGSPSGSPAYGLPEALAEILEQDEPRQPRPDEDPDQEAFIGYREPPG